MGRPLPSELTHYYKLVQIVEGACPLGLVRPLPTNPRTADYPPALQPVSDLFNASYRYLFLTMSDLFGPGAPKKPFVRRLYRLMEDVLSEVADFMVEQPIGEGRHAAPTFEIFAFGADPGAELTAIAEAVAGKYPELTDAKRMIGVVGDG